MKNIYFISDVHLAFMETAPEIEKREKLLDFLDLVSREGSALYLLGDIFDFWFEWYHVVPKYWFPILYRLRRLVDQGVEVNFIPGNHDFYTGTYLAKEIGLRCFSESVTFSLGGKRFFAAHGDGYARSDRGYRFLKRVIRSRVSQFLYRTFIPSDLGMLIARWTSKSSRKLVRIDKDPWSGEYLDFALDKFSEGFDYVLLGHIHEPVRHEEGGKIYINCGDWMREFSYAKYDGKDLTLEHFQPDPS